ncbi:MAG TPA: DEAD/DEAH box helicase [Methanothermobacter sp.]|nr:putative ski2-type helicase [Methanothermobacter sp. MT-2]HHW05262.1 DEAD/DEAH box helicase [Methanothermobacter sp.]HOK72874.1 DEAD/DEAH box helicase [Methanothermobacter sp.]HOL69041.1 DEAD/DEAH box helicase [Methanothermobacter sp.]HPQ04823.1 DEAD/DEAH box helicase [Methanothermobacter sp.]
MNTTKTMMKIIKDCYPHIKDLNPAQQATINKGYLEDNHNYILAIPTASGKTLLGLMAAIKTILEGGKVIYTVPLLSIQNEKIKEFKELEKHGIRVGKDPRSSDFAIMVFESFDILTRFSWNTLHEIDLLIIDEFHMIGEYTRGPTIECAITRSMSLNPRMRIIALSATLSNLEEIATWLNAKTIQHDYRPVPLYKEVLTLEMLKAREKNEAIVKILEEAIKEDSQILVFISTRRFTEALATFVSQKIHIPREMKETFSEVADKILEIPKKSGSAPTFTCLKLAECIKEGVAFHHAGLFTRQREIIEDEFRNGNLYMITATPSLMYGVNLPSQIVVIRDYTRWTRQGPKWIPVFDYEQMSGRAGRPQYDNVGYSYLIAKTLEEAYQLEEYYIDGEVEPTNSKLIENKDAVYHQIIGQIAAGLADNPDNLVEFFKQTFYGHQLANNPNMSMFTDTLEHEINSSIEFLIKNEIIKPTPSGFKATTFGLLIANSNYSVETSIKLRQFATEMEELDIHRLIYEICKTPDMPFISFKTRKNRDRVREKLQEHGIFTIDVGNPEATAASLIEWINERSEYEIENAFNVYAASTRRAAYEASQLIRFFKNICEVTGIYGYSQALDMLIARLYYGVKEDIIPLVVGVKRLGRIRARRLVNTFGYNLKNVDVDDLQKVDGIGPKMATAIKKYAKRNPKIMAKY